MMMVIILYMQFSSAIKSELHRQLHVKALGGLINKKGVSRSLVF